MENPDFMGKSNIFDDFSDGRGARTRGALFGNALGTSCILLVAKTAFKAQYDHILRQKSSLCLCP